MVVWKKPFPRKDRKTIIQIVVKMWKRLQLFLALQNIYQFLINVSLPTMVKVCKPNSQETCSEGQFFLHSSEWNLWFHYGFINLKEETLILCIQECFQCTEKNRVSHKNGNALNLKETQLFLAFSLSLESYSLVTHKRYGNVSCTNDTVMSFAQVIW